MPPQTTPGQPVAEPLGPQNALADADQWAERVARSLPPLSLAEAAAVGRAAAALDTRATAGEAA